MRTPSHSGICYLAMLASCALTPLRADWDAGDPHSMLFPQLPDPTGWDIRAWPGALPNALADDWYCPATGLVNDIHVWFSVKGGEPWPNPTLSFSIWSNVPEGPYGFSVPGSLLWQSPALDPTVYTARALESGMQGWFDPITGETIQEDHTGMYQVNYADIPGAFEQQAGQIYWLGVSRLDGGGTSIGWKTSQDHYMDGAVQYGTLNDWSPVDNPMTGAHLDMAFVISPVPEIPSGMMALLAFGGAWLMLRAKPNRRPQRVASSD